MATKPSQESSKNETPKNPLISKTRSSVVDQFKSKRKAAFDVDALCDSLLKGNITALSRAITLIESTKPEHRPLAQDLLHRCLPYSNSSKRIGITGVPGVGKSSFIEAFGCLVASPSNKVAILAVDPSSSISKGSVLGDKTRMQELSRHPDVFIRPSPAGSTLGGVARKTRETILLCEAFGFQTILVETVGVGQSETVVHSMVDFFLVLKLSGAGDELQGIKRGIIELADSIVINKADGDNLQRAKIARSEFSKALKLYPPKENGWKPKVLLTSAIENKGIIEVNELIEDYIKTAKENHSFDTKRLEQNKFWLYQSIEEHLKESFYQNPEIQKALRLQLKAIEEHKITPFAAAQYLISLL